MTKIKGKKNLEKIINKMAGLSDTELLQYLLAIKEQLALAIYLRRPYREEILEEFMVVEDEMIERLRGR